MTTAQFVREGSGASEYGAPLLTEADVINDLREHAELCRRVAACQEKLAAYRLLMGNSRFERELARAKPTEG